jgi:hypothetical protein
MNHLNKILCSNKYKANREALDASLIGTNVKDLYTLIGTNVKDLYTLIGTNVKEIKSNKP